MIRPAPERAAGDTPALLAALPGPAACFPAARPGQPGPSVYPPVTGGPGTLASPQRRIPAAKGNASPAPGTREPNGSSLADTGDRAEASQAPSPEPAVGAHTADPGFTRGRERSAGEGRRRAAGASLADLHAAAMSEDELEEQVRDACTKLGILRFHVRISKGTTAGLPDDILIGPRGILWRELKNQTRKPTPEQVKTGAALTAIGQDYALWRPEDWFSGRIVSELRTIAHTPGVLRMFPSDGAA